MKLRMLSVCLPWSAMSKRIKMMDSGEKKSILNNFSFSKLHVLTEKFCLECLDHPELQLWPETSWTWDRDTDSRFFGHVAVGLCLGFTERGWLFLSTFNLSRLQMCSWWKRWGLGMVSCAVLPATAGDEIARSVVGALNLGKNMS